MSLITSVALGWAMMSVLLPYGEIIIIKALSYFQILLEKKKKESTCSVGNLGSIPGLGRSPWRRAWQTTPVFLSGETPWAEEPDGLQSLGLQRVGHD